MRVLSLKPSRQSSSTTTRCSLRTKLCVSWCSMLAIMLHCWVNMIPSGETEVLYQMFTMFSSSSSTFSSVVARRITGDDMSFSQTSAHDIRSTVHGGDETNKKQPWNVYSHQELCHSLLFQAKNTDSSSLRGSLRTKSNTTHYIQLDKKYCHWGSTGNNLGSIFMTRLIAAASGYEFQLPCRDHYKDKPQYEAQSVPYHLPQVGSIGSGDIHTALPSWQQLCQTCDSHFPHGCKSGLEWMAPIVQQDLQLMSRYWQQDQEETDSSFSMDDTIIHFRCGDILARHVFGARDYGYSPYSAYDVLFNSSVSISSIGIITNTFDSTKCRELDCPFVDTCRTLALDLKDYLKSKLPDAKIRIHNTQNDTVRSSFARMILSKQVFCDSSSFCLFPAIGTSGTGVLTTPDKLYPWASRVEGVKIVRPKDYLGVTQIHRRKMNVTDIIQWRRAH